MSYEFEDESDEYKESRAKFICEYAAIFVTQGIDRQSAIQKAKSLFKMEEAAERDITGTIAANIKYPKVEGRDRKKVDAIAKDLYVEFWDQLINEYDDIFFDEDYPSPPKG